MHKYKVKYIIILATIFLAFFSRFYKLDQFPVQLNHDEISQLYDVGSIVKTSKDIYGNFLPLAFPSTGDYKVGHYIYISVIPYLFFGNNETVIRFPAAIFGALTVPIVFLFMYKMIGCFFISFFSAFFVAINPSHIFYSRKSFESIIGVFFIFLGLYLLMELIEKKSKLFLFLTPIVLAIPMYLYTAHTTTIPLIILVAFFIYRKKITNIKKTFLIFISVWVIAIIPLIYLILFNEGIRFRAVSVSVFQDVNLQRQLNSVNFKNPVLEKFYQSGNLINYLFNKYLNQFEPGFIFEYGLNLTNQAPLGQGPLMLVEFPLLLIGVILLIRKYPKSENVKFIFCLALISMIPSAITFEDYSPHRSVMAFTILSIISACGAYFLTSFLLSFRRINSFLKIGLIVMVYVCIFINALYFINTYTINYPYEKSQQIHFPLKQVSLFAWSRYNNFDKIIIDPTYGQWAPVGAVATHYYIAYYGNYPPQSFQKEHILNERGLFFDKFEIRKVDWNIDRKMKKTLIISSPWNLPINSIRKDKILKEFDFYDKSPAYYAVEPYE